jgi:hypothetical protein
MEGIHAYLHIPKCAGSNVWNTWARTLQDPAHHVDGMPVLIDDSEHRLVRYRQAWPFPGSPSDRRAAHHALHALLAEGSASAFPEGQRLFFHHHRPLPITDATPLESAFAIVREPVARTVSHLRDVHRTAGRGPEDFARIAATSHFCPVDDRDRILACRSIGDLLDLLGEFLRDYSVRFLHACLARSERAECGMRRQTDQLIRAMRRPAVFPGVGRLTLMPLERKVLAAAAGRPIEGLPFPFPDLGGGRPPSLADYPLVATDADLARIRRLVRHDRRLYRAVRNHIPVMQ